METENNHDTTQQGTQEKRHFDSCSHAFQSGREDATAKAREAAPRLKGFLADAVFDVAYSAAYGAFFAGAFAHEFVPQSVKDGLAKGAAAGRGAASKMRERTRRKSPEENAHDGETIELPAPA